MATPRRVRFANFELDTRSGELRRDGVKVHLQEQPFRILLMLIERAGNVVTREEMRRRVWRDETFVDFDHGLNSIVNRLREGLGDSAENPMFIQTLPRRGYRFLAPVEEVSPASESGGPTELPTPASSATGMPEMAQKSQSAPRFNARWIALLVLVAALMGGAYLTRRLIVPPAVSSPASGARLAVLPFDNLTGDKEQQFFVDGLHEEMIFRLGRMQPQRLAVLARTSVLPYRDATKTIAAIARDLDVDYVLEGSVRQSGERFRITVQLIHGDDESHLWTETYERAWKDVFAIQTDVGARVAESLAMELVPAYQAAVERDGKVGPRAHEHYLRGRFYWNQRTRNMSSQLTRAIEQFQLAIAEAPDYALAYVGLADAYDSVAFSDPASTQEAYPKARQAIERALQLDPELPSAHATLAWMTLHFEHDWPLAERAFRRALELDPNDSLARFRYSHLIAIRGRLAEAEREAQRARKGDPLSVPIADILAWYSLWRGADTEALQRMREAADLEGEPARLHGFASYVHAVRGDCDRAAKELQNFPNVTDEFPRTSDIAFAVARCGDASLAEGLRQELVLRRMAYPVAMVHLARREMEAFYDWLNRAIDARSPQPLYIGLDPAFRDERQDPRFQAALRRLGL